MVGFALHFIDAFAAFPLSRLGITDFPRMLSLGPHNSAMGARVSRPYIRFVSLKMFARYCRVTRPRASHIVSVARNEAISIVIAAVIGVLFATSVKMLNSALSADG